jgi:hypothetical protein
MSGILRIICLNTNDTTIEHTKALRAMDDGICLIMSVLKSTQVPKNNNKISDLCMLSLIDFEKNNIAKNAKIVIIPTKKNP